MNKGIITISVDKDTTQEDIKEIRRKFTEDSSNKDYSLVILVSGKDDMKLSLGNFLAARLKS